MAETVMQLESIYEELSGYPISLDNIESSIEFILPENAPASAIYLLALSGLHAYLNPIDGIEHVSAIFNAYEKILSTNYPEIYNEYLAILNDENTNYKVFRDTENNFNRLADQAIIELDYSMNDGKYETSRYTKLKKLLPISNMRKLFKAAEYY